MDRQVLKLGARILENLPHMSSQVMQGWIDNPVALQSFLRGLAPQERVSDTSCHRYLKSLTLAPTKGTVTIVGATEVFTGFIDPDFNNRVTDQPCPDTPEVQVDVHEMTESSTFKRLFGSFGTDLRQLCLSQGQVVEFCRTHCDHLLLNNYGTFFLCDSSADLFVVHVYECGGELHVDDLNLGQTEIWSGSHRRRLVVHKPLG
jgi:hypothetical protein